MRGGKIALLVVGAVLGLIALGLVAGGGGLLFIHGTQRDATGYYHTSTEALSTTTYAITSEHIDLGADTADRAWTPFDGLARVRLRAARAGGGEVFVGIARQADVDRYLAASAHAEVSRIEFNPYRPDYRVRSGEVAPEAPATQDFWVATASGPGRQTLTWRTTSGDWAVVVMNADASRGVAVDASVGVKTGVLLPIGLGLLFGGLLFGALAAALILMSVEGEQEPSPAPAAGSAGSTGAYPVRLDGQLEPGLNRGLWLVKWFLAIPHFVILCFLWIALFFTTFAAGIAILFTGRYPRALFDFAVGVMRWTWRVTFYAFTLGTDRYPPFSLQPDPSYPAHLAVDYPGELSRGLVLVKWWLLALPHYIIVGVFVGGAGYTGLVGILVLVAAVALLFTGRYPTSLFDFVMGMQRWTYRVLAYGALLRDEYPPFRLDAGGTDPGSVPVESPPPSPPAGDRSGELVGV